MPPRLSKLNLWKRHEERVCEVLAHALMLLLKRSNLTQDEDSLNRELYGCLGEANSYFYEQGRGLDTPFFLEARNQPSADHGEKHEREGKRPDLQNGFVDHSEPDPRKQNKNFVIECKRLGSPPSPSWILNANYVNNGISRFINEEHEYGRDVESGAMVGYVESSDFDHILEEVNTALNVVHAVLPPLTPKGSWDNIEANVLQHVLERYFPVSPFVLKHFWIDLRGKLSPLPPKFSSELEENSIPNSSKSRKRSRRHAGKSDNDE